jgi:outer membrane protein assembly factor BamB
MATVERFGRTAVLVVVLVAVACGNGGNGGEDGAAPESDAPAVGPLDPLWSVEGIHVVSHPVAAGGTAVVLVAEEGELFLTGYAPATGEERWRTPSAAAPVSPDTFPGLGDVPSGPLVVDDTLVHLVPGVEPGRVYVEAVDGQTGETLWRSEQSQPMLAWLGACDAEERRVCAVVASPSPSGAGASAADGPGQALTPTVWAVDVADGTTDGDLTGLPVRGDNPRSSLRNPDIAIARIRGPGLAEEQRIVVTTGEVLWTRSWQELFGDQRFDLEDGSESQVYWSELDGLLVGMVDVSGGLDQQADGTTELIRWVTSGVDPDSGETLWTVPGSGFCGGVYQLLLDVEGLSTAIEETDTIIRCEAVGTVERTDGRPRDYEMDVTVTQVDVRSGDILWSAVLPGFDYYIGESPLVRLDPTTFAGQRDDGSRFALDLATGELRDAETHEVGWCFSDNEYRYEGTQLPDGADEPMVPGARFTRPCDLAGTHQPTPSAADEGLGAAIDGTFIWMDDTGLHAAET